MRYLFSVLIFTFLPLFCFSQSINEIEIDKQSYDLGLIKEKDGKVLHSYLITNNAKSPLIISKLEVSCGCTSTKWEMKPILPGKSTKINLIFDPKNRPGNFNKTLRLICNFKPGFVVLTLRGFVLPKERTFLDDFPYEFPSGLRFKFPFISFGKLVENKTKEVTVEFINNNNNSIKPIYYSLPKGLKIVNKETIIKSKSISKISFSINAKEINTLGIQNLKFKYKINNKEFEHFINVNILEDFSYLSKSEILNSPEIFIKNKLVNVFKKGGEYRISIRIYNRGKSKLKIHRIYSKDIIITKLNHSFVKPNKYTDLNIKINHEKSLNKRVLIRIISNDYKHPETKIRLRLK